MRWSAMSSATCSPRRRSSLNVSSASAPDGARTIRYSSPKRLRRSRATAASTAGSSPTAAMAGRRAGGGGGARPPTLSSPSSLLTVRMRDPVVIGVDVGTTGTKALAVTADGTVVAQGRTATPTEPEAIVAGTLDAVRQAVTSAGRPVAGLALCGAMHSLVGFDAHVVPVTPLLTWADD